MGARHRPGRRTARAFLHPVLHRPNLEVRTNALVTKILFSGTRAVGVRYEDRSRRVVDVPAGHVVLAGGAFNSPHLLQLSGVGNARFRYLSTPADRRFWVDAVHLARDVLAPPAFAGFDGGETYPGPSVQADGQIVGWVAGTAQSNMHPTSTCRLGVDDRSMLDPATMGVHGIAGLSVADASAMPYCPSTATHAPTMMLAQKAADLILGNTSLAPQPAAVPATG